jgi:hypothetical protein
MALEKYRSWFLAAAIYNFLWGILNIVFPRLFFELLKIEPPSYLPIWQVVGMFVLVYSPAYWWAARHPEQHPHLIVIGLLGKLFGPIGFLYSFLTGQLPLVFGWTILTNDLIWWPAFFLYLKDSAALRGGMLSMLRGD